MLKRITGLAALTLLSLTFVSVSAEKARAQDIEVSYQNFYDQLAPYGQWVNDPAFGDVFVPNVPMGFRPYASDGYWAMTDQGNMWMSNEPWAWACYHYGRWTYNGYYGWIWIPGYQWAPSWVSWRYGGGYCGWAPMGPGYNVGGVYNYPDNYWVFVTPDYLYRPNVYEYYGHEAPGIYLGRTSYITETYGGGGGRYYYGPSREMIERETHQPIQVYHIASASRPGVAQIGGNQLTVYRPAVNQASAAYAHPANVIHTDGHPIGRSPEPVSAAHQNARPEFHQQHPEVFQAQPQHAQPQQPQRPQQIEPQQRPQAQPQRFQQPEQQSRPQQPQQQSQPQRPAQPQQQRPQQAQPQQQRPQPQQQQRGQQQRPQPQRAQQKKKD